MNTNSENRKQLSLRLPEKTREKIKAMAEERGTSQSNLVMIAVDCLKILETENRRRSSQEYLDAQGVGPRK